MTTARSYGLLGLAALAGALIAAGAICSNLPVAAGVSAAGSHGNGSLTNTGQTIILASQSTTLYGSAGPTGVSAIFGSITYHV